MTKLQYLALRTVFSAEIARREDRDLARIIKTLVDDPIEQRIRERRPKAGRRGRCRQCPSQYGTGGSVSLTTPATEKRKASARHI